MGKGLVEWEIADYWNVTRKVRTTAYYIPSASARLFSPQSYFQENNNRGKCIVEGRKITLHLPNGDHLEFPNNQSNNLPMILESEGAPTADLLSIKSFLAGPLLSPYLTISSEQNANMDPVQKELTLLHQKLGHIFSVVSTFMLNTTRSKQRANDQTKVWKSVNMRTTNLS